MMNIKELICKVLGHKRKEYPPLHYWIDGKAVPSPNMPVFCERCGAGQIDMWLDELNIGR